MRPIFLAGLWPFAGEGVGYAPHHHPRQRGDRGAYPTYRDDTSFGSLLATLLETHLVSCPGAFGGAILAPGKRTVASALRALGLGEERRFCRYHRVLSRASWSSRQAGRVLLELLVEVFVPEGPLILGIDETLERRRGKKIHAKGIYRDPVRSSHEQFVKTSGLRWVCLTLLAPIPWASRMWALPFLSALAYSERYAKEHGKRHKPLTEWAW